MINELKIKQEIGNGKTALTYEIISQGQDFVILVYGGEAHIGATVIGDKGTLTSYTVAHHRDDLLAMKLAQKVSESFRCVCTVIAGFHLDSITEDEIKEVLENSDKAVGKMIEIINLYFRVEK